MTQQPEALRLAESLEITNGLLVKKDAAAELRRLHSVNKLWMSSYSGLMDEREKDVARLTAINAQLLAALQEIKLKCTSLADAQVTALQALAHKPSSDYRDWDYQDCQEHKQSFGHHLGTNAVSVTWPKL